MNSLIDLFLTPQSLPFAVALTLVAGLFVIELVTAILGGTLLGAGGEGPDLDLEADFDFSAEIEAGIDLDSLDLSSPDIGADVDGPEIDIEGGATSAGLMTWIGAQNVPFLIWLVTFLTMFGLIGLSLQSILGNVLGFALPALLASLAVLVPALFLTRLIASWVAMIMPKTETTAMPIRALGGCHGTITQGTASRGKSAEVKVKDRHDNIHYLRVEPLRDEAKFPQGSFVVLVRKSGDTFYVI